MRVCLISFIGIRIIKYSCNITKQPDSFIYKLMYITGNIGEYTTTYVLWYYDWFIIILRLLLSEEFVLCDLIYRTRHQYRQKWNAGFSECFKVKKRIEYLIYHFIVKTPTLIFCFSRFHCLVHKLVKEEGSYIQSKCN